MPIVTMAMVEGRTVDEKRELAKRVTDDINEVCGIDKAAVTVRFEDMQKHDYAKGGQLFCDK